MVACSSQRDPVWYTIATDQADASSPVGKGVGTQDNANRISTDTSSNEAA